MKRLLASAICAAAVFTVVPSHAADPVRTVEGNILAPTVRDSTGEVLAPTPISRHARCVAWAGAEAGDVNAGNGTAYYQVSLEAAEADGEHTFTLSSDAGNIAVIFYENYATCADPAPVTASYVENPGGEAGSIPELSGHAVIVVEDAANVNFTFSIFAPEAGDEG